MKKYYPFILIILAVSIYGFSLFGFFQQDEWPSYANHLLLKGGAGEIILGFFKPNITHYVPFAGIVSYLLYNAFDLNYAPYALIGILSHLAITFLVYKLVLLLLDSKKYAFLSALLFATSVAGYQAVVWVGATTNTQGSTLFGLLSLVFLVKFIKGKLENFWYYTGSILFLVSSIFFKENTIALFVLLPAVLFLFGKRTFKKQIFLSLPFIVLGLFYASFRIYSLRFLSPTVDMPIATQTQTVREIGINLATFPVKTLSQIVIPTELLVDIARFLTQPIPVSLSGVPGTTMNDRFVENVSLQFLFGALFVAISLLAVVFYRKSKNGAVKNALLFGYLFVVLNSFIYALSPGRAGIVSLLDSRNLYFPLIGYSLFMPLLLLHFIKNKRIVVFAFVLIVLSNIFILQKNLLKLRDIGIVRKKILYQVKEQYPNLPEKVIFYMESDISFYGLPPDQKILPFQNNLGFILLVWYQSIENYSSQYIGEERFLRKITDQGYREYESKGFGYFREIGDLKKTIIENHLPKEALIAYRYSSKTNALMNISDEVWKKLF